MGEGYRAADTATVRYRLREHGPYGTVVRACSAEDHRDTRFYEPSHEVGHNPSA